MVIQYAYWKHCSTRTWLITCSLSVNWKELLVCVVVAGVVGIFSDPLDRHLLSEGCTVVAFSQPILSWPPKPVRITTMVSFAVIGLPSACFNSHHLRVTERNHCLRAVNNRKCWSCVIPTCSSHSLSSTCSCTKNRSFLALLLLQLHCELGNRSQ